MLRVEKLKQCFKFYARQAKRVVLIIKRESEKIPFFRLGALLRHAARREAMLRVEKIKRCFNLYARQTPKVCAGFNLKNPHSWGFFYGRPYCSARQAKHAAPNTIKKSETAPFFIKQSTARHLSTRSVILHPAP
jgi:hypothetical protein